MNDETLTTTLRTAHKAIAGTATEHELQNTEVRVLMCITDRGYEIDTYEIEEETQIVASNVRKALYVLANREMIEFVQKERGKNLIVISTVHGRQIAKKCNKTWAQAS